MNSKPILSFKSVFITIFIFETAFFLWLFLTHRISAGHDTTQYFIIQYYFLNHLISHGEIPQWMPYMTQGTVATWWFSIQADFFQNALMIFHPFLKTMNFTSLFTIGIFWKHLVLLCGVWLWGRVHFKNPWALLFFCSSIMGSTIWMSQIWYSFHLYYTLPLVFFFIHQFLQTSRWRWFFLAGQLWLLQSFGNMPYFLPMTAWVLFSYFALFLMQYPKILIHCLKRLRWLKGSVILATHSVTAWGYIHLSTAGTQEIINYNPGRNLQGTTDLNGFLTYGGTLGFNSWLEALTGISPMMDYTLYSGVLIIVFTISGILLSRSLKSKAWIFIWAALLFLLNLSLWPASWLYQWWPLMKFYRHLALFTPITKIAICLWATVVLDHLLEYNLSKFEIRKLACLGLGIILGIILLFVIFLKIEEIIEITMSPSMYFSEIPVFLDWILASLTSWINFHVITLSLTFIGLTLLILNPKNKISIISVLVVIHVFNIYGYKTQQILNRTIPNSVTSITQFKAMPYAKHRQMNDWLELPRSQFLLQLPLHVVKNWASNSFIYLDEPGSTFRVDHWLKPLDQYLRIYWKQNLDDFEQRPKGLMNFRKLTFPTDHPAALKFSAVTKDKIQFFSSAFEVADIVQQSQLMNALEYMGDTPFLLKDSNIENQNIDLTKNSRINLPFHISRFSANHILIDIDVPVDSAKWLVYSDVWHPQWQATDNEKPVPIYRANLAYKAIALFPGKHQIKFQFFSKKINILIWTLAWLSLAWVGGGIFLTLHLIFSNLSNFKTYDSEI